MPRITAAPIGLTNRSFSRVALVALTAAALLTSCDDDSTSDSPGGATSSTEVSPSAPEAPAFGSAIVEPLVVQRGDSFTVTPAAAVRPICTRTIATIRSADIDHTLRFQLLSGGEWYPFDAEPPPTFPACLEEPSTDSIGFRVAADFPVGVFLVCITFELSEDGCGTFEVVAP